MPTAFVLYDNNGEYPFAVYSKYDDPEILAATKKNPHVRVRSVEFEFVKELGNVPEV